MKCSVAFKFSNSRMDTAPSQECMGMKLKSVAWYVSLKLMLSFIQNIFLYMCLWCGFITYWKTSSENQKVAVSHVGEGFSGYTTR